MAVTHVIGNCLYSGQGMCNAIELYDGATLKYLMLLDFGAEKDTATVRKYTLEKLKLMITNHGKIDAMVISHSDSDHWKLMNELLKQLPSTVTIDVAAFGIGQWKNNALTFQNLVKNRMAPGKSVTFYENAETQITDANNIANWIDFGGVKFSVFAASVITADTSMDDSDMVIESNTASLVIRVLFGGNSLIFTGDATATTLQYMNNKLDGKKIPNACYMMTAPHHGALATLDYKLGDLVTFTASTQPTCALASAQLRVNFNHPNVCVMSAMAKDAGSGAWPTTGGNHDCVLNFKNSDICGTNDIYKKMALGKTGAAHLEWYVVSTNYNIFTTVANLTTVVDWSFRLESDGKGSVTQGAVTASADAFFRMTGLPPVDEVRAAPAPAEETQFFVGRPPEGFGGPAAPAFPPLPTGGR